MTKKSLGYVHLVWTCPNCDTRNPGPQKVCSSCGMPQPDDVKFEQPAEEKLIQDEAEIAKAKVGPDIHCAYCGTRNPASAETCSQCGASLTEGAARASGQVLGAHRDKPAAKLTCPACGAENEPDAAKCVQCGGPLTQPRPQPPEPAPAKPGQFNRYWLIIGGVLLLLCAGLLGFMFLVTRTEDTAAQVQQCAWTREVAIEELGPVTREEWRDQIPAGVVVGRCRQEVHHTETQSTGQTEEVCGEPYTVDTGSGYGEVVQDCTTEEITEEAPVYADKCEYIVEEWHVVDKAVLKGNGETPRWPEPDLRANQRAGERDESYEFTFRTEQDTYTYSTGDAALFAQCRPGERWQLQVNTFNTVTGIEPAQ